ncbi:MAG: hypothetical protein VYD90_15645 [Pseudomonadota bacterium]|nr:hypothetical protein [Pseudomonadota bacterium]
MLTIEIAASDGQGDVNEDCVGHCGAAAWVIDGATGVGGRLTDAPSDAAWLARTANDLLARILVRDPQIPTVELIREVTAGCAERLDGIATRLPAAAHELPSAAFAMVRVIGDEAELTTLADCRIVAEARDGEAALFGSSPLDARGAELVEEIRNHLGVDPEMSSDELGRRLLPGLQAMRSTMNRDGGYWVLGTSPEAADNLWQMRIPLSPGARFAIASDGFLRLIEMFGEADPADHLAICDVRGWTDWLNRLRSLERAPGSRGRFPRVKIHDDASLLVCRWEGDL